MKAELNYLFRELWVLQITDNVKTRTPGRPRVKIVANMHGDETTGREHTFQLAQFITENYQTDPIAKYLIKNIDLHLMPRYFRNIQIMEITFALFKFKS